jgi:ribosomal protein L37AE/L43A
MGKVKSELLTEYPCANPECDVLFDSRRAALGYQTCMQCGDALARKTKHTIVQEYSKGPYQVVTNFATLKQTNPKRQ